MPLAADREGEVARTQRKLALLLELELLAQPVLAAAKLSLGQEEADDRLVEAAQPLLVAAA